jgi:outer membrane protein assembly factor BamB
MTGGEALTLRRISIGVFMAFALALSGCDMVTNTFNTVMGDKGKPPLPGKRVDVLPLDQPVKADLDLATQNVALPRPEANTEWPQSGGFPDHAMQHLALSGPLKEVWNTDIGEGSARYSRILSQPVVADGHIFGLDGEDVVFALDAATGHRLWNFDPKPEKERDSTFGGGVAYSEGKLYVTTGYGDILALNAADGKQIWRQHTGSPLRGSPTVMGGRVLAVNVDNQLIALAISDGQKLWTHTGLPETADLLGTPAPAVAGDTVVAAYSSGELYALRLENGKPVWNDNLAVAQPLGALNALADIRGRPVIDRGRVFAVSHSGRMVSIDLRTGDRVWEQDIGGSQGPWVAGDYVYVLSNDTTLLCLTWKDGKVRWARNLPRYENEQKKKDPILWVGPVLAGDRLIVVASTGEAFSVSPYTGEPLGRTEFPAGVFIDPVVANNTVYVLTDNANLIALR